MHPDTSLDADAVDRSSSGAVRSMEPEASLLLSSLNNQREHVPGTLQRPAPNPSGKG
jgi:hypothetical protein